MKMHHQLAKTRLFFFFKQGSFNLQSCQNRAIESDNIQKMWVDWTVILKMKRARAWCKKKQTKKNRPVTDAVAKSSRFLIFSQKCRTRQVIRLIALGTVGSISSYVWPCSTKQDGISSPSPIAYRVYSYYLCTNTQGKSDLCQMCKSTSTVIRHPEHAFAKHSAIPKRDFQYRIPAGPVHTAREMERDI